VTPDDVKRLAVPVLAHRLLTHGMRQGGKDLPSAGIIRTMLDQIPVPR
jgi:MoxR-like ATPase